MALFAVFIDIWMRKDYRRTSSDKLQNEADDPVLVEIWLTGTIKSSVSNSIALARPKRVASVYIFIMKTMNFTVIYFKP